MSVPMPTISDDSPQASGANVALVSGQQIGDRIGLLESADANGDKILDGTSIGYVLTGTNSIAFSGLDTYEHYRTALDAIRYTNTSGSVGPGERDFAITITDDEGLTSNTAIMKVVVQDSLIRGTDQQDTLTGTSRRTISSAAEPGPTRSPVGSATTFSMVEKATMCLLAALVTTC